jgi:hypothetical protein
MYAVRKGSTPRLTLDRFFVTDDKGARSAGMGERTALSGRPVILAGIDPMGGESQRVTVDIIRNGEMVEQYEGDTPLSIRFVDSDDWAGKGYYRLSARVVSGPGLLLANPIFVERR